MSGLSTQLRLLRAFALVTYPFACVPFLFLYFQRHGLDTQGYGVVIGVYYLAMFLAEVPTGVLADRFGPKAMLVTGPVVLALGFATLLWWPTYAGFLAGEALLGLGHAVLSGPPATILYETLKEHGAEHRYLREEAVLHALRLCGTGTAFLLGGALSQGLGDDRGPAFGIAIAVTCLGNLLAAAIATLLRPEPGRPALHLRDFARTLGTDLLLPPVRWLLLYWIVLFALLRFPFHNYQPYFDAAAAREPLFARPLVVGGIYALLNVIAAPLSIVVPRLVAGVGRTALFWAMPLLLATSLLVMAWERWSDAAGGNRAFAWLGVSMFLLQQVPYGMHWSLISAFVNHRIGPGARTTVMSAMSLLARLCYAGLNVLLFAVQARAGLAEACMWAGGVGALATVAVMAVRPRRVLAD